jgi:peptidoglycan/LPS O-acetylase OafA/YrhL
VTFGGKQHIQTAAAPTSSLGSIPSLDGIRALSFLLVFGAHAGFEHKIPGGFGVTIFFFLSGYLITTLIQHELRVSSRIDIKAFYLRRSLRILPPFYVVLALALLLPALGVIHTNLSPGAIASQLFHVSNIFFIARGHGGSVPGTGVYWSLAVEEHFYLVFPIAFAVLHRRGWTGRRIGKLFGLIAAGCLAWRVALVVGFHASTDRTYLATDTRIDSILFGCMLALFANPIATGAASVSAETQRWMQRLRLPAIGVLLAMFVIPGDPFRETIRYTLQGLALMPVFFVAIRQPTVGLHRVLNHRALRWLGRLSYPLYLVHYVVMLTMDDLASRHGSDITTYAYRIGRGLLAFAVSLAIATLIHRFIEKPCARVRRRLARAAAPEFPSPWPAPSPDRVGATVTTSAR